MVLQPQSPIVVNWPPESRGDAVATGDQQRHFIYLEKQLLVGRENR